MKLKSRKKYKRQFEEMEQAEKVYECGAENLL